MPPFEKTVKVDKRELDPFGQREQALQAAKAKAHVPRRPNAERLEFDARDRGDHYEITVREVQGVGPRASRRGQQQRSENAPKRDEVPGLGLGLNAEGDFFAETGEFLSIDGPQNFDIQSHLESQLSETDVRRLGQRHGIPFHHYDSKSEKIRQLIKERPDVARRAAGVF